MTAQAELFARCPAGSCRNPVEDPRVPCDECRAALGPWLREVPAPPDAPTAAEFAAESAAGDEQVRQILADRAAMTAALDPVPVPQEKRRDQECWCCGKPRVCTPDPMWPERWMCRSCAAIGA